jgi:5-methylthioadenosine/S-adenosylhomocysteine deaminase
MMWGVGGTIHGCHAELRHQGANVALGSDSSNWGVRFDIGMQGYLGVLTTRERTADRRALGAYDALEMATINGARAVGLADVIGSLESGKRADLVIRANDVAEAYPLTDPLFQLVYSARSKSVHTVIVDGRPVIEGRQPTGIDRQTVFDNVERSLKRTFERMEYRR